MIEILIKVVVAGLAIAFLYNLVMGLIEDVFKK